MNLLFSCIGKRGYIADYFREHLRAGERIFGSSHTPWTPGFQACDEGVILPPIASDEYVPALLEACERLEITGLLSFFDPDVAVLANHREALQARGTIAILPGPKTARVAFDKLETFRELRALGFLVPETTSSLGEALDWLDSGRMSFPLVVKPRCGFGSANTFVVRDAEQLGALYRYAPDMIVQQHIDGEAYDVEVLADLQGKVVGIVPWRNFLSRLGETEQSMTVDDPELLDLGRRVAEAIGLIGPMDSDLFRTPDGRVWILELNLRFGGGYPVSHLAGAAFPGMIVSMLRGEAVEPRIGKYERGIVMMKALRIMGGPKDAFLQGLRGGGAL